MPPRTLHRRLALGRSVGGRVSEVSSSEIPLGGPPSASPLWELVRADPDKHPGMATWDRPPTSGGPRSRVIRSRRPAPLRRDPSSTPGRTVAAKGPTSVVPEAASGHAVVADGPASAGPEASSAPSVRPPPLRPRPVRPTAIVGRRPGAPCRRPAPRRDLGRTGSWTAAWKIGRVRRSRATSNRGLSPERPRIARGKKPSAPALLPAVHWQRASSPYRPAGQIYFFQTRRGNRDCYLFW
jgi:hypothetical protein